MIVYVTQRAHFNAGHRLHNPALGDEENRQLYGKCNNPSGHGHNYVLEVTLRGEVDPEVGVLANPAAVDRWIWRDLLDHVDHRNLNTDVEFMRGLIPTSENLARAAFEELEKGEFGHLLWKITIHESENNAASFSRQAAD